MASVSNVLMYDAHSKQKFVNYFIRPPLKRGRPKKKSRGGRPKKKKKVKQKNQTMVSRENFVDMTTKVDPHLDARIEGQVAKMKQTVTKRINWDLPANAKLRARIADSWKSKKDLYNKGESFGRFCIRMNIDRNVLKRFLQASSTGKKSQQGRGRPPLLPPHVMRHLCEGMCLA